MFNNLIFKIMKKTFWQCLLPCVALTVILLGVSLGVSAQAATVGKGVAPDDVKAVDLGLPSGTKWANKNIGAREEGDYGLYFAWGETTGYEGVDMNPNVDDGREFKWESYKWGDGPMPKVTKYCTVAKYGEVDNVKVLAKDDDAAAVCWGSSWRMPTEEEFVELIENTTCTEENNIQRGLRFVSKINGNSIFLPAGGIRNFSQHQMFSLLGCYWSATVDEKHPEAARSMRFTTKQKKAGMERIGRFIGQNIRAVSK